MSKHDKQGAPKAPPSDDTSWLDGEVQKSSSVKILSLRPGSVTLQDKRVLEYHKVLDVDSQTAEWLFKSFPGLMQKI